MGGLLGIQNTTIFQLSKVCFSRNFLILEATISSSVSCAIVDVYGPRGIAERNLVWEVFFNLKKENLLNLGA